MEETNTYTTAQLEKMVFWASIPYNDSKAFQAALEYVRQHDAKVYKDLLRQEAVDCGAIK